MKEGNNNNTATIGAFVVALGAIGALYGLGRAFIAAFSGLDPKYGAALAAAAGTVIVSVISVVVSRYLETRAAIDKELRDKRIRVYEDLISFMLKILMAEKSGKKVTENDVFEFMSNFTQKSMVWAADDVLNAWIKFRVASVDKGETATHPFVLMFIYEDLIRAIRKDLGHKNKDLTKGKLLSLFVNDIGNYVDTDGNITLPANMITEQADEPKVQ